MCVRVCVCVCVCVCTVSYLQEAVDSRRCVLCGQRLLHCRTPVHLTDHNDQLCGLVQHPVLTGLLRVGDVCSLGELTQGACIMLHTHIHTHIQTHVCSLASLRREPAGCLTHIHTHNSM